ncbi:hypothetical protein [Natronoflexus pectinivorans]|nr:hypothetical protein [Natronoflexus pectinivorans]
MSFAKQKLTNVPMISASTPSPGKQERKLISHSRAYHHFKAKALTYRIR